MVTAIYCETCGTTIPHTEPGLTEHIGHRVSITTRPSVSDAAPLAPKDSTLTFSKLDADRPPIVLNKEYRERTPGELHAGLKVLYSDATEGDLYAESMEEREAHRQARRVGIPSAFKPWVTPAGPSPRELMSDGLDLVRRMTGRKAGRWCDLPDPWLQLGYARPITRWDRL